MQNLCYREAAEANATSQVPTSAELLETFRENFGLMPHLKVCLPCVFRLNVGLSYMHSVYQCHK